MNTGAVGSSDEVWPLVSGWMENGLGLDAFDAPAVPNIGLLKAGAFGSSDNV